jgi:ABC-type glycerol-3-phosphate transport system substrate-binding protein
LAAIVGQAGGRVVEADGTVSLGGRAGEAAIRFWQALVTEDRSMKPPPGRDYNAWEQTNQDFLSGRTAMIWTSTAFLKYLEQNAAAVNVTLTPQEIAELDAALPPGAAAGTRYPEAAMQAVNR